MRKYCLIRNQSELKRSRCLAIYAGCGHKRELCDSGFLGIATPPIFSRNLGIFATPMISGYGRTTLPQQPIEAYLKPISLLQNSEQTVIPRKFSCQSSPPCSHNVLQLGQNPSFEPTGPKGKLPGRQPLDMKRVEAAIKLIEAKTPPAEAARQLGLGRSTVYREMRRLGIQRPV